MTASGRARDRMAVHLSRRAERDLRGLPRSELVHIRQALLDLDAGAANLDVKPLSGAAPWLRLRSGDFRILYRPIDQGHLVARVVNRRELVRAVEAL
jgi:mRNA-degrading endonuclease RelE of RelBE toxin-antitoxin system